MPPRLTAQDFDQELLILFDAYVHGDVDRRGFLKQARRFAKAGMTAAGLLAALSPDFAAGQQVAAGDARLKTEMVAVPSPSGYGSIRGYLARGFNAVKIKVGHADLADDVARVRAVRELIGPDRALMVDANYALSVPQAIAAANAFKPYDLVWFEEPTIPDDYDGYARIAEATGMPLAEHPKSFPV